MQGPREAGNYIGRHADCQRAILPLVTEALRHFEGGLADAESVLEYILPEAFEAGWHRSDIEMALRMIAKARHHEP